MKIRNSPARVVFCTAVCEICETDLKATGTLVADGHEHKCPGCGDTVLLDNGYPCYKFEPVD